MKLYQNQSISAMDYTEEILSKIEKLAKEMMTPSEISFLLGINEVALKDDINTIGHPARKAYMRGFATTAHELRRNIREAAIAGSPYSISEALKQLIDMMSEVTI